MGIKSSDTETEIDGAPGEPNVQLLTIFFTVLYLFMATQDIAVDGWALTMLSRENVGYGSVCNTIGQLLGYSLKSLSNYSVSKENIRDFR